MQATVYKSTGSWYTLKTSEGNFLQARIKGVFKIDAITSTNPIAVGDKVGIVMEPEGTAIINEIFERRNYITRQSPVNKHQHHIIASNLDQSFLFATLKEPKTSQGFIDRFLITAEAYHIPAVIIFNKCDIWGKKEEEKFSFFKAMYEGIGYTVKKISVENNEGMDEMQAMLKDKTTLLSGHSGVGKSSFLNKLVPEMNLKTQEVSGWSGKGLHTTTFAEMYDLFFGGCVIDTPGIRELGLVDITRQELSHYFPEMKAVMPECQFNNCMHLNEPSCAVKNAVGDGTIHMERYISYCNILESIEEKY